MQHIFGIVYVDSDGETIESDQPHEDSFMGLPAAISEGKAMLKQNPKIKQINIYAVKQGQHIPTYYLLREKEGEKIE